MNNGRLAIACAVALTAGCSATPGNTTRATTAAASPDVDLWALAPADATAGIVVRAAALRSLDGAFAALADSLADHPTLRPGVERLIAAAIGDPDAPAFPAPVIGALADHRDYAAFFTALEATPALVVNADPRATRDWRCAELSGHTVCARDAAVLDDLDTGAAAPLATTAAALPAALRGPIQLVADLRRAPLSADQRRALDALVRDAGVWAVACRLDEGAATCRARLTGAAIFAAFVGEPVAPTLGPELDRGAVAVTRARIAPRRLLESLLALPAFPLAPGVDLRRDLVDQLGGELAIATAGSGLAGGLAIASLVDDRAPARVVEALCMMARLSGVARVEPVEGGCVLRVRPPGGDAVEQLLVNEGDDVVRAGIAVRGGALRLELGAQPSTPQGPRASEHTAALLEAPAQLAMWARSFDPLAGITPPLRARFERALQGQLDPELFAGVRWLLGHVAEAGFTATVSDDAIELEARLVTFAADPPAVYRAYRAAVARDIEDDHAGYRAGLAALADAYPNTLAGRHAQLVAGGVPAIGPAGIIVLTLLLL